MDPTVAGDAMAATLVLIANAEPRCGTTKVVAIDGPSGAGKTDFTRALAARLGSGQVVHMDDLYPGWDGLQRAVADLHDQVLVPLSRGEQGAYRRWDWAQHRYGQWCSVPATNLLLVEGAGSGARPGAGLQSALIWLEADRDVRLQRGIDRDGEAYRPHWRRWAASEEALFALDGTRGRADLIVNTSGSAQGWE